MATIYLFKPKSKNMKVESKFGKWNEEYVGIEDNPGRQNLYGDTPSYKIGADFLSDCKQIEDWGCGAGGFKKYRELGYTGIDGSKTPYASKQVDLTRYKSNTDGIFMRHVLEHNENWEDILVNALRSARKKVCLIIFTPLGTRTRIIANEVISGIDVPDISFKKTDLIEIIEPFGTFKYQKITKGRTQYFEEHIFEITKF